VGAFDVGFVVAFWVVMGVVVGVLCAAGTKPDEGEERGPWSHFWIGMAALVWPAAIGVCIGMVAIFAIHKLGTVIEWVSEN